MEEEIMQVTVADSAVGTISDTYLDYFTGIVEKLPYGTNYVIWKSGEYEYTLAYGDQLELDGTRFTGTDCSVVQIYRQSENYSSNWLVRNLTDDVEVSAGNLFIYSDLGMYPGVGRGVSRYEGTALLFAIAFATLYIVLRDFFRALF